MASDGPGTERRLDGYLDLGEGLPEYECPKCGWLHGEGDAWGLRHDSDRLCCPECGALSHSREVRRPDYTPNELTGFGSRTVRAATGGDG